MLLTFAEVLLRSYEQFCTSTTGGSKTQKEASKCRGHVSELLTIMDISDVKDIASSEHLNILEKDYLTSDRHKHKATTIANYLRSLNDFCDFLYFNSHLNTGFTEYMAKNFAYRRKKWMPWVNKQIRVRHVARQQQDKEKMMTPLDVGAYLKGKRATEALGYLNGNDPLPNIIPTQLHGKLRNYIIIRTVFANATRAGGICNMTVEEFKSAVYFQTKDQHVVQVCEVCWQKLLLVETTYIQPILQVTSGRSDLYFRVFSRLCTIPNLR